MYVQKNNKMFYALLIAITIQAIGLAILTSLHILEIPYDAYSVIGTIVGSFLFGVGIVLAVDVQQERGTVR